MFFSCFNITFFWDRFGIYFLNSQKWTIFEKCILKNKFCYFICYHGTLQIQYILKILQALWFLGLFIVFKLFGHTFYYFRYFHIYINIAKNSYLKNLSHIHNWNILSNRKFWFKKKKCALGVLTYVFGLNRQVST